MPTDTSNIGIGRYTTANVFWGRTVNDYVAESIRPQADPIEVTSDSYKDILIDNELNPTEDNMEFYTTSLLTSEAIREMANELGDFTGKKTATSFLSALVTSDNFPSLMASFAERDIETKQVWLRNTLEKFFMPFLSSNISFFDTNLEDNCEGDWSLFSRSVISKLGQRGKIESIKIVLVSREAIFLRVGYRGEAAFHYHVLYLGRPLALSSCEVIAASLTEYGYKDLLDEAFTLSRAHNYSRYHTTSSGFATSLKHTLLGLNNITHNVMSAGDMGITSTESALETFKATQAWKKHTTAKEYILTEGRLAEKGEKAEALFFSMEEISFRDKKGIRKMFNSVLRCYPILYHSVESGATIMNIKTSKIVEGGLDPDKEEEYRVWFEFKYNALHAVLTNAEGKRIALLIFFDNVDVTLTKEDLDAIGQVVDEAVEKLGLDNPMTFASLIDRISSSTGKLARQLYFKQLQKKDSFYIDQSTKSFFDGIVQTLAEKVRSPKINGKIVDARVAPTTHAMLSAKDKRLQEAVSLITKKNYYRGGVNVHIKR